MLSRKNSPFPSHRSTPFRLGAAQSHRSRIRLPKARFWRALLHFFFSSQLLLTLKCNLVSSHLRKLRFAYARLRERASLSNGNAWHLPRFIALLYIFEVAFSIKAQFDFLAILWGRKNTFAIRPNKCKSALRSRNFCAALLATVRAKISRALSSLCGLRAHFTFGV